MKKHRPVIRFKKPAPPPQQQLPEPPEQEAQEQPVNQSQPFQPGYSRPLMPPQMGLMPNSGEPDSDDRPAVKTSMSRRKINTGVRR